MAGKKPRGGGAASGDGSSERCTRGNFPVFNDIGIFYILFRYLVYCTVCNTLYSSRCISTALPAVC